MQDQPPCSPASITNSNTEITLQLPWRPPLPITGLLRASQPPPHAHICRETPHTPRRRGPPEPSGSSENERWKRAQGQWGRGLSGAVMTQGGGAGREEGAGVL